MDKVYKYTVMITLKTFIMIIAIAIMEVTEVKEFRLKEK